MHSAWTFLTWHGLAPSVSFPGPPLFYLAEVKRYDLKEKVSQEVSGDKGTKLISTGKQTNKDKITREQ